MVAKSTASKQKQMAKRKERVCTLPEDPHYVPKEERVPRKRPGRPTTCTNTVMDEAQWYLDGGWQVVGDAFPSIVGLACELQVNEPQLYQWKDANPRLAEIMKGITALQQRVLINGGVRGKLNPVITKLILGKHGYSDKVDSNLSNPDGSLRPQVVERRVVKSKHDKPTGADEIAKRRPGTKDTPDDEGA